MVNCVQICVVQLMIFYTIQRISSDIVYTQAQGRCTGVEIDSFQSPLILSCAKECKARCVCKAFSTTIISSGYSERIVCDLLSFVSGTDEVSSGSAFCFSKYYLNAFFVYCDFPIVSVKFQHLHLYMTCALGGIHKVRTQTFSDF